MKLKFTAAMAVVLCALTGAMTQAAVFSDIQTAPWPAATDYILRAADLGLMNGEVGPDGIFLCRPAEDVTLCETLQLVYTLAQKDGAYQYDPAVLATWNDLLIKNNIPAWAGVAVSFALEDHIVTAEELESFMSPEGYSYPATRQEAALYLGRFYNQYQLSVTEAALPYGDESQISKKALPYVKLLYSEKIMLGSEGLFRPNDPLTRAEMAVIMTKTYDKLNEHMTKTVSGYVASIVDQGNTLLVAIDQNGSTKGFRLNKTMATSYEGQELTVSDLKNGDLISVMYQGTQVTDIRVAFHSISSAQTVMTATGYIKSIAYDTITLDDDSTYPLAEKCLALIDGQDADMKDILDLMDGASVYASVTVDEAGEAVKITAEKKSQNLYEGKIYDLTQDTLMIENGRKQYPVSDGVTVTINNKIQDLDDLIRDVEDMGSGRISCTFLLNQAEKVTKITAEYEKDDEVTTKSGLLKAIGQDSLTVGSTEYTISGADLKITDGAETITSISGLRKAMDEDQKEIRLDISYRTGTKQAVKVTGEVTGVTGELVHAWADTRSVMVRMTDGRLKEYACHRDMEIVLAGWKEMDLGDLDSYLSDEVSSGRPVTVDLTLSDNQVEKINVKK